MGFEFKFAQAGAANDRFAMNWSQMSMMVEVMREAGAIREQGSPSRRTLLPEGVSHDKFRSNDGQQVTPEECLIIAGKLRAALDDESALGTLSFFDDAPPRSKARDWITKWADYNERAAAAGGYLVH